jgi:hypothetical protein
VQQHSPSQVSCSDSGDHRKHKKMADDFKGTVIIYSSIGSPACMKAKLQLAKLGIPYTDVSLDSFPQVGNY